MRCRIFSTSERSGRSMAEQTDAVNFYTVMEEFQKSGKMPSVQGLPLGSFEADAPSALNLDLVVDSNDSALRQADKLDRRIKLMKQMQIAELRQQTTPPAAPPAAATSPEPVVTPTDSE